jgi:signal peptidase II
MGASFFLDRITKHISLKLFEDVHFLSSIIELKIVRNPGAAFGILREFTGFLIVIGGLAILFIFYLCIKNQFRSLLSKIFAGLLLGGIIGNTYDRAFFGYVIDIVHFPFFPLSIFQVFNLADVFIVFGVLGIIINDIVFKK